MVATGQVANTGMVALSYVQKVSEKVSLAADLMYNYMSRDVTSSFGYDYILRQCRLRGKINSNGVVSAFLEGRFNMGLNFILSGEIDHQKKKITNLDAVSYFKVEVLTRKSQLLAVELERTSDKLDEATAWVQHESEKNSVAKETIKCLMSQLKDMASKVPHGASCRVSGPFADNMYHVLSTAT